MNIGDEISQPFFENEFFKANINLIYTASWIQVQIAKELKPFNITTQQFNILRILRGCKGRPASIRQLTERMLDQQSNASRLVDKLCKKELAQKSISEEDNRRMEVLITPAGLELVGLASQKIEATILNHFNSLTEQEATQLSNLLDKLRES